MLKYKIKQEKDQTQVSVQFKKGTCEKRELERAVRKEIDGLVKPEAKGEKKILYTVPAQMSLKEYLFGEGGSLYRFYSFWVQLLELMKAAESEKLSIRYIVLDAELIFVDEGSGRSRFLYLPVNACKSRADCFLRELSEPLAGQTEYEEVVGFLERNRKWTIEEMTGFIRENYPQACLLGRRENSEERQRKKFVLHRNKNGQECRIDKNRFLVGTSDQMDYRLDNRKISRSHLIFMRTENAVCIEEDRATNGTWVNGMKLEKGDVLELYHGDVVRIADEEFTFLIQKD